MLTLVKHHAQRLRMVFMHIVATTFFLGVFVAIQLVKFDHGFPVLESYALDELLLVYKESPSGVLLHDHLLHGWGHAYYRNAKRVLAPRNDAWVRHYSHKHRYYRADHHSDVYQVDN